MIQPAANAFEIADAERRLAAASPAALRATDLPEMELEATMEPDAYRSMVLKAKDYIEAGDIFQVVISQRLQTRVTAPPFEIYRTLRVVNPSPFMFFLRTPHCTLVGSSPEIMVRVVDGKVTVRPLAGTRRRGQTAARGREHRLRLVHRDHAARVRRQLRSHHTRAAAEIDDAFGHRDVLQQARELRGRCRGACIFHVADPCSCASVHCRGLLSGRQRKNFVPCRKRPSLTWS